MKIEEIEKRGFQVTAAARIDMRPRRIIEVRLSKDDEYVSLLCTDEALENRLDVIHATLMVRFHTEIAPIPDFGRGDIRVVDFFG